MKRAIIFALFGFLSAIIIVGCTRTDPAPNNTADPKASQEAKAKYLLASEPAGAKNVIDLKKQAKDGDEVVVVGRIGGSKAPFVKDRASFTIVDTSVVSCDEMEGWKDYPTPWEFC